MADDLSVELDKKLYAKLKLMAEDEGVDVQEYVLGILNDFVGLDEKGDNDYNEEDEKKSKKDSKT